MARRSVDPSELFVSTAVAERQRVTVVDLDGHTRHRMKIDRLELLPMDTLAARDLLWRIVVSAWHLGGPTKQYEIMPMSLHGPTPDGLGAVVRMSITRPEARRPAGDTRPGTVYTMTEALLTRRPVEGGYGLEPVQRDDAGRFWAVDSLGMSILIGIDCLDVLPTTRR